MFIYVLFIVLPIVLYKLFKAGNVTINLPGPTPWPLFGNTFQINPTKPHLTLDKWHQEYNKVYKMYNMGEQIVVVGSVDAIHEALVKKGQDFAGRPPVYRLALYVDFQDWQGGITFAKPVTTWKTIRHVVHKSIKMADGGRDRIQYATLQVCEDMIDSFMAHDGKPFEPRTHVMNAITNNLTIFMLGKKFTLDEPLFRQFLEIEKWGMELFSPVGKHAVIDYFPWLRYFGNDTARQMQHIKIKGHQLYEEMKRTMVTSDEGSDTAPILQSLLHLLEEGKVEGGELRIEKAVIDLIFAGSGTSTSSLHALLNILTHYPDVQTQLQEEVDHVIGERPPTLDDKDHMPYTRAVIMETLRYTSIVPTSVPHYTTCDTELQGVSIPKGTPVFINLYSSLHDADYWPEPYRFNPERFLDESGQLVQADHINRKRLMAFGAGPRVCIGEVFALNRMFLLLTSIVQRFDILQDDPKISCEPSTYNLGIISTPPDFMVRMIERKATF